MEVTSTPKNLCYKNRNNLSDVMGRNVILTQPNILLVFVLN